VRKGGKKKTERREIERPGNEARAQQQVPVLPPLIS